MEINSIDGKSMEINFYQLTLNQGSFQFFK